MEKRATELASVFCSKSLQGLGVRTFVLVLAAAPLRSVSWAERADLGTGSREEPR